MKFKILRTFSLLRDKEDFNIISENIEKEAQFRGTNLWILFFAILIASLGLNLNSSAVVIGAMLISPLMGPIVGVGVGVEINDLSLLRRASTNYFFAAAIGLTASTLYFLVTPINAAHSEILSRTSPTVYDALIALFGGFAGIIAISSKLKGNVIPGVAIATALMPPLCTAGYGLATWQLNYFVGALYLYIINSVFIAAATIITVYLLKFPKKEYADAHEKKRTNRIIWAVVIVTLIPSVYLAYKIVQEGKFTDKANQFIDAEAVFPNDYLLRKEVDADNKVLTLTFGGKQIADSQVSLLKTKLKNYGLEKASIKIKQGFSFVTDENTEQVNQLGLALNKSEEKSSLLKAKLDSINNQQLLSRQIYKEMDVQYPGLKGAIIQPVLVQGDTSKNKKIQYLALLYFDKQIRASEKIKLEKWLKVRLNNDSARIVYSTGKIN